MHLIYFQTAFELAVIAYVFVCILQTDKNMFVLYGDFLNWLASFKYGYIIAKPLGYCEICFAGQLAFWLYLKYNYKNYLNNWFENIYTHIFFISLTILFTFLINKIIKRWLRN